ncbi:MAG: alpha/beta fold hydrolase [Rhodobacteraceae bacterium]|nr:alpha/beta fold hydrolase [Paracoccaceae bacterium]
MAEYLLIHGSCHGAWCWRDVIPALEALGHAARAIDLPAHGDDRTPAGEATLEGYAEAILAAIENPVTLVGHSAGGYPITLAAQMAPEKIRRLIYLCAYAPAPGLSMIDMRRAGPRQTLKDVVHAAPDGVTYSFDLTKAPGLFYHDCPPEAAAYALPRLCPEPILPQSTALPESGGQHPDRHYITCDDDRVIPPEYQRDMALGFSPESRHGLPCGHSPFFTMPGALAALLSDLSA